ncbi:uncharacterized protein LOC111387462 [Olea europaea var. sylvestris]|uniref:uncharacterized protein LOC111387462 n=1 Tax=Olea europaea var. sylvestris TaxID=158386 RepID=UPI000C1D023C|nr:uncharacterized protein LOC111387462 [Olea europaea var. sylvestris]
MSINSGSMLKAKHIKNIKIPYYFQNQRSKSFKYIFNIHPLYSLSFQGFSLLDRFDGTNYTRWKDKLKFLLAALKIFYILDSDIAPLSELMNGEVEAVRNERQKCQEDELISRGQILNALSDCLYDLYINTISNKEIWEALENKYKAKEEGTKKFYISKYFDFKLLDNIPLLSQIHEMQIIVNKLKAVKIDILEIFQVGVIIAKLPETWKGYRLKIMHSCEDYSLEQLQKHLRIEEESRIRDKTEILNEGFSKPNVVEKIEPSAKSNKRKLSRNFNKSKKKIKGGCFMCGRFGHYAMIVGTKNKTISSRK